MAESIRTFGDPVLTTTAAPVADVDGKARRLVDKMFGALYATDNGLALAAPQIGVQKRVVVWDFGEDPRTIFNPEIVESDGEWVYEEGCLSIPGLYVEIVRPKTVLVRGIDSDGNPVEREADEVEARMFQHELDHLNGVLMFERMTPDQRHATRWPSTSACRPPLNRPDAAASGCTDPCASPSSARPSSPSPRCGRSWPPATTSTSSSPAPTAGAAAAVPRRRAR